MNHLIRGGVAILLLLYPFLVCYSLAHGQFVWVSSLLILLGVSRLFFKKNNLMWPLTWFAILCGGLSLLLKDHAWLKLYPVLMSVGGFIIFSSTLFKPPSMIERFARLAQPDLPEVAVIWTKKVTIVWCLFFILNTCIALYTVLFTSTQIWVLYNGFISYLLMGLLFAGEFILRKIHQRKNLMS